MSYLQRIAGASGPWAVALGLHGAVAAAAALAIVGSSTGPLRPAQPTEGVFSVNLRPAGAASALAEPPRGDGRVYTSIEPDPAPVDGPIADIPELKVAPAPFEIAQSTGSPGTSPRRGGHDRLPATAEGRGSGSLGSGSAVGLGQGTASPIPAVALEAPGPRYPDSARRRSVEGAAVVEISIRADGSVERGRIVETSGSSALDDASIEAVRTWRYRPATLAGKAVSSVQRVKFVFRLE